MAQPFDPTKLEGRLARLEFAVEALRLQVMTNNQLSGRPTKGDDAQLQEEDGNVAECA